MAYKVKQNRYHHGKQKVVEELTDLEYVIRDAMFRTRPSWGYPEDKGIEGKIEALGSVLSRLLAHMLDNGMTPDELKSILWDCDFEGEIVEVEEK
jgi:hypothetical protein